MTEDNGLGHQDKEEVDQRPRRGGQVVVRPKIKPPIARRDPPPPPTPPLSEPAGQSIDEEQKDS
jgi:hypothetical protein